MTLLIGLGFIINLKKSVLNPTTTGVPVIHFEFADDNITPARQAVLAKEAVGEVQELGKDNGTGTIPSVMNDGGSASDDSTSSTVLPTPGSREDQVTPNGELVQLRDIRINIWDGRRIDMVVFQVSQFNSRPLKVEKWDLTILSDASKIGWGATCRGKNTGGPWTTEEAIFHINYLELLAAFFALKSFASQVENASILLRLDNVTAIAFINKMGATHSQDLSDLAVEIWRWCIGWKIFIHAKHLPGKENVQGDWESRHVHDSSDWRLNRQIFLELECQLGPFSIDLFASRTNTQLESYCSWKPDPYTVAVDALSIPWTNHFPYLFPPFALIT